MLDAQLPPLDAGPAQGCRVSCRHRGSDRGLANRWRRPRIWQGLPFERPQKVDQAGNVSRHGLRLLAQVKSWRNTNELAEEVVPGGGGCVPPTGTSSAGISSKTTAIAVDFHPEVTR